MTAVFLWLACDFPLLTWVPSLSLHLSRLFRVPVHQLHCGKVLPDSRCLCVVFMCFVSCSEGVC
jgi:hypothetical protein